MRYCPKCGIPLPERYPNPICEDCYKEIQKIYKRGKDGNKRQERKIE